MLALVATSITAVTFIVERGLALRWGKVLPPAVEKAADDYAKAADLIGLRRACVSYPSALSRLILCCAEHLKWSREENTDALETRARHEIAGLERGLVVLEIIVGIAPLLGLVGTVYGLISLFSGMSEHGLGEYTHLAKGIGLALNTTLAGLLIAIPALITWSYYSKKVETLAIEMETICDDFLRRNYQARGAGDQTAPGHREIVGHEHASQTTKERPAKAFLSA